MLSLTSTLSGQNIAHLVMANMLENVLFLRESAVKWTASGLRSL